MDEIITADLVKQTEPVKKATFPKCEKCGLQNSENCNSCTALEKYEYSYKTGV